MQPRQNCGNIISNRFINVFKQKLKSELIFSCMFRFQTFIHIYSFQYAWLIYVYQNTLMHIYYFESINRFVSLFFWYLLQSILFLVLSFPNNTICPRISLLGLFVQQKLDFKVSQLKFIWLQYNIIYTRLNVYSNFKLQYTKGDTEYRTFF